MLITILNLSNVLTWYQVLQVLSTPRIAAKLQETAIDLATESATKQVTPLSNSVMDIQMSIFAVSFVLIILCLQNYFFLG